MVKRSSALRKLSAEMRQNAPEIWGTGGSFCSAVFTKSIDWLVLAGRQARSTAEPPCRRAAADPAAETTFSLLFVIVIRSNQSSRQRCGTVSRRPNGSTRFPEPTKGLDPRRAFNVTLRAHGHTSVALHERSAESVQMAQNHSWPCCKTRGHAGVCIQERSLPHSKR